MAHIGAIEELLARGYEITSISGCSIGSLIGGIYAAGRLAEARDWFCALDKKEVLSLTDFSFGLSHMVKGNRVMDAIKEWVPDMLIEKLPIPAAFVATDMTNGSEVVFRSGPLFEAIRASISIPLCFEPVRRDGSLLIDGGLCNPFPLNRVARTEGDILVGVNISGRTTMHTIIPTVDAISMVNRMIDLQIQASSRLMIDLTRPDVLVEMPQDAFSTFDFDRAAEIMDRGRELMSNALDAYEKNH